MAVTRFAVADATVRVSCFNFALFTDGFHLLRIEVCGLLECFKDVVWAGKVADRE